MESDYYSRRYKNKESKELDNIANSEAYEQDARLGAIRELERRGELTESQERIKSDILGEIEKTVTNRSVTKAELRYKTFWLRFFAAIVDGIVLWPLGFLILYLHNLNIEFLNPVVDIISSFSYYIYSVLLHGLFGQTIGKYVLGVKVFDVNEERGITMKQAFIRDSVPIGITIFYYLLSFIPFELTFSMILFSAFISMVPLLWWILEIFSMLFNQRSRAIHDLIAKTVVVRTE